MSVSRNTNGRTDEGLMSDDRVVVGMTVLAVVALVGAGIGGAVGVKSGDVGYTVAKHAGWDKHEAELWGAAIGGVAGGAAVGASSLGVGAGVGVAAGSLVGAA